MYRPRGGAQGKLETDNKVSLNDLSNICVDSSNVMDGNAVMSVGETRCFKPLKFEPGSFEGNPYDLPYFSAAKRNCGTCLSYLKLLRPEGCLPSPEIKLLQKFVGHACLHKVVVISYDMSCELVGGMYDKLRLYGSKYLISSSEEIRCRKVNWTVRPSSMTTQGAISSHSQPTS